MANKIPWYVNYDRKNVTGFFIISTILIVIFSVIYFPEIIHDQKLSEYEGEAIGTIISIHEDTVMNQGHNGTKIYIGSYTIKYFYQVNDQYYTKTEKVNANIINTNTLNKTYLKGSKQLKVKYDESEPKKATILIE